MNILKWLAIVGLSSVILLSITLFTVLAQDDDTPPLLTLTSPDNAHPVQFQPLTPGDPPISTNFVSRLDITADTEPLIYVILENTGWSDGTIGLISDDLAPDETYVALEVRSDGDGGYIPRENGLIFELAYDEELGGFVLPVLISQMHTLAIYRMMDADGLAVSSYTNVRDDGAVEQIAVEYMVDVEPVFGALVLDLHIVAHPIPTPIPQATSTPVMEQGENPPTNNGQSGNGGEIQPTEPPACVPVMNGGYPVCQCGAYNEYICEDGTNAGEHCLYFVDSCGNRNPLCPPPPPPPACPEW